MSGQLIPLRSENSISGTEFVTNNLNTKYLDLDNNTVSEITNGNVPNFLRNFKEIHIKLLNNEITYLVMPDVLCIGGNSDFLRIPMGPKAAVKIADKFNCVLPTKKMCDQIWKAAEIKLNPVPKGPPYDNSMLSINTFKWHNDKINSQLSSDAFGKLISGHKKDVIIDKDLLQKKDKVSIYGWFKTNGVAIQGPVPNSSSHEISYYDYSHGIRLVAREVMVNGKIKDIIEILSDKDLANLISDQGCFDINNIYR